MKRKVLLFLIPLFLILIGVVSVLVGIVKIGHRETDNVVVEKMRQVEVVHFLIPVASFSRMDRNISLESLKSAEICIEMSDKYSELALPGQKLSKVNMEGVIDYLKAGGVCLLAPELVSSDMQSLVIEGHDFWDAKQDIKTYPLKYSESFELSESQVDPVNPDAVFTDNAERMTIFVSGEIIPARAVDRLALNKNNNYTYLYDYFATDIAEADLAIALLENPINGNPAPCTGCMVFVGDEQNAKGLKTVGYDVLALAGNHAGDGGQSGFRRTIEALDAEGILHAGTGSSDAAKIQPALTTVKGKTIGMISADTVSSYYWNKGSNSYGANWFSNSMNGDIDKNRVAEISRLKKELGIDYLIIYMSWGVEYTNKATGFQTELAHLMIDNGADLIVASHPHWVQNIEYYKGKPIFYALGNFIFDQNHADPTRQGVNLNLSYAGGELKSVEIMPHLACGPFVSSTNLTDKYLKGDIDRAYLDTHDERQGCVYFQPRRLQPGAKYYSDIWNRLLQHSNVIK